MVARWREPRQRGPPRSEWRRWLPIRWHSYGHRGMFCSILSVIFKTNLFTLLGGGTGDSGTSGRAGSSLSPTITVHFAPFLVQRKLLAARTISARVSSCGLRMKHLLLIIYNLLFVINN